MSEPRVLLFIDTVLFATPSLEQAFASGRKRLRSAFAEFHQPSMQERVAVVSGFSARIVQASVGVGDVREGAPVRRGGWIVLPIFEVVEPRKFVEFGGAPACFVRQGELLTFAGSSAGSLGPL